MNICIDNPCTVPATVRGLCDKHYGYHYRHGTLESVALTASSDRTRLPRSVPGNHSLTDIDSESKTGTCSVCGVTDVKRKGKIWRCGNKVREVNRNSQRRNPKKSQMTLYYGNKKTVPRALAVSERTRLTVKQESKCAICGTYSESLHLDHCHDKGTIRGLLCVSCNIGLGHFRDNPKTLQAAIDYLNQ